MWTTAVARRARNARSSDVRAAEDERKRLAQIAGRPVSRKGGPERTPFTGPPLMKVPG